MLLANADVTITESCDDLLAHYVERGVERVTPWGWGYGDVYYATEGDAETSAGGAARDSAAAAPVPQTTRAGSSGTGTNVQEEGVDEPDVVKTDGELLVRIQDDVLTAYSLTGEDPVLVDTIDLPDVADAEILLVGDEVVVIGRDTETASKAPEARLRGRAAARACSSSTSPTRRRWRSRRARCTTPRSSPRASTARSSGSW